jgi:hypothetical protein
VVTRQRAALATALLAALGAVTVPASASTTSNSSFGPTIRVPAGSVVSVTVPSFIPITAKNSFVEGVTASAGDFAGAALVNGASYGIDIAALPRGCQFAAPCRVVPDRLRWGFQTDGKSPGVQAGRYDLVILGRPSAVVSLRLRRGLTKQAPRFTEHAQLSVDELSSLYPSTAGEMPESYFDKQLTAAPGRNITVLVGHLEGARPKSLQYSTCVRSGPVPAVHVPNYGSACTGSDAKQFGGSTGAVSVGGSDCNTVPPPTCLPLTTSSFHVTTVYGMALDAPAHVSLTADIRALQSDVRTSALTFALPAQDARRIQS